MVWVRIHGWRPGPLKVSLTQAIRAHTGLGLAAGKRSTDLVLAGQEVAFDVDSRAAAQAFVDEVRSLGADADIVPEEDCFPP